MCSFNGLYPPTIENTRLPTFTRHPRFSNVVANIKSSLFSKLKRHLYAERQRSLDLSSDILSELKSTVDLTVSIASIQAAQKATYRISSDFHEERLRRRLKWLLQRNGLHPDHACTDLSGDPTTDLRVNSRTPSDPLVQPVADHQQTEPNVTSNEVTPISELVSDTFSERPFLSSSLSFQAVTCSPPTCAHHELDLASPPLFTSPCQSPSPTSNPHFSPPSSTYSPTSTNPTNPISNPVFLQDSNNPSFNSNLSIISSTNHCSTNNNPPEVLVTDLTGSLSDAEKRLLSKGPKFAINQPINDKTRRDTVVNFCRLANQLRWNEHWRRQRLDTDIASTNNPSNSSFPNYPYKDEIHQPPRYNDFERKLTRINEVVNNCLNSNNHNKPNNLLPAEARTLAELKKKELYCLPSDKGGEFCVIGKSEYIEIGKKHLDDINTYTPVNSISAKTIELRINKVWKDVAKRNNLDYGVTKRYTSNNTDLSTFYFLIKTHKPGPELKIRPIVSNINSPTSKISWLLDKALKPLLQHVPSHLENTSQLMARIEALPENKKTNYVYPFSLDVTSLYTSIPQQRGIEVIKNIIDETSHSFNNLNSDDITLLLSTVITNNYFTFDGKAYKQNRGLAMGSSVSAIVAILYMSHVEAKALSILGNCVGLFSRYVDDIFVLAKNRADAIHIHETFNNTDSDIKFEIEHPDHTNTLKLLDIAIRVQESGNKHYEFYKKSVKKDLFVNFKSSLPTKSKMHFIRNERSRIMKNCSTNKEAKVHLDQFNNVLKNNGYPETFIHNPNTFPNNKHKRSNKKFRPSPDQYAYFNFPYISDTINRKLSRCFIREGLNVRLYHKNFSLRNALKVKTTNNRSCKKKNCIVEGNLCFRKNVVYKITCNNCRKIYIGSTIRPLHDRIYEHVNNDNSSVKKHFYECRSSANNITIEVLEHETRKGNLRIREAYYINKHKPELNSKEENCIDLILF